MKMKKKRRRTRKLDPNKLQVVHVSWIDASVHTNWANQAEFDDFSAKDFEVETIGFLVRKDKKYHIIAQSVSDHLSNLTKVPTGMISNVRVIESFVTDKFQVEKTKE